MLYTPDLCINIDSKIIQKRVCKKGKNHKKNKTINFIFFENYVY